MVSLNKQCLVLNVMRRVVMGLVACIALTLFSSSAYAYVKYPIDFSDDSYIKFGGTNEEEGEIQPGHENGLILDVVEESISHSWVDLNMIMWGPMVADRHISHFLLLANGKIIEEFRPAYVRDDETGELEFSNFYSLKASASELIGAPIYFQVVAVERDSSGNQYAVAWSNVTEEVQMDDLPVKDKEAIAVLYAILEKLKEMLNTLAQILKELMEQTRPTPEKLNEFYNTISGLLDKMPMKQVADELAQLNDRLEEDRSSLNAPYSLLVLGGRVDLLPLSPGGEVDFMDLRPYREQIVTFRTIMQASIWVFFFHMLFKWVTPRPEV